MAVSLVDFLYGTNEAFAEKAYSLVKCWRVGIKSCKNEWDLIVLSMYLDVLTTDLTDYNITATEVRSIITSIINIFNITNVTIEEGDIISYITTNNIVNNYVTEIITEVPSYEGVYSGVNNFTVTVNHGLGQFNCNVVVTDTSGASKVRVYPSITDIDEDTITLEFESTSSGTYKVTAS